MKIVVDMGQVYCMSDGAYRRMLTALAEGKESPTWRELKAKRLGEVACDTTDMEAEDARRHLGLLEGRKSQ